MNMPNEEVHTTHTVRNFRGLVVTVRLSKSLSCRVWLAVRLIWLAAWMLGGKLQIDSEPTNAC